MIELFL